MRARVIVLTLFITACASVPPADTGGATEAMNGFVKALNALDPDAIAATLAPDVTAFFPSTKPERVEGKDAVNAVFRAFCEESRKTTVRTNIVPEAMTVSRSGDLAVVSFQVVHPAVVSRRTFTFRRDGERWLIVHLHASNVRLEAK
ncbi:MAG: YybH family protein [Thermoanaerobaculia bacterium]